MEVAKRVESFVFYIDEDEDRSPSPDTTATFSLLPNEREICDPCKRVILYQPYCNNRHGILGTLHCTTFRLVFIPIGEAEIDTRPLPISKLSHNLRYETPLLNVHSVFYTSNSDNRKFRILYEYLAHADQVSIAKVFCKDFRVFVFDFKIASEGYRMLLNGLILKSHPKTLSSLVSIAVDASASTASSDSNNDWRFPTFNEPIHWEMQLRRLGVPLNMWRITRVNETFRHIDSYPPYFVVPALWMDNIIISACVNWSERRVPVWCWSSPNGSALIRSAHLDTSGEIGEKHWLHYEYVVSESHYMKQKPVTLDTIGLSFKDIGQSAEQLRKLCSMDSADIFWDTDVRWSAEIEKTGWFNLIIKAFSITEDALSLLFDQGKSVILREPMNCDAACLLSSLIQICADSYSRTVEGFHLLIQKEWCSLSHPFPRRLFGLNPNKNQTLPDDNTAPVFLLFLDCVHQLMEQNPTDFEFSNFYLIALWDLALSGACKSLLFNNAKEYISFSKKAGHLRPAWVLSAFYKSDYIKLFNNPLYCFVNGFLPMEKSIARASHSLATSQRYMSSRLEIRRSLNDLSFWTDCYLRWTSPCQVLGGGSIQAHLELLNICAEITDLLNEFVQLTHQNNELNDARRRILRRFGVTHSFFRNVNQVDLTSVERRTDSHKQDYPVILRAPERITSGFPYTYDTLPVPELLYAIPVRTECQQAALAYNPRSLLELSALSELNTDIRRLSMAKLGPSSHSTIAGVLQPHSYSNPSSPLSPNRPDDRASVKSTRKQSVKPVPLAEPESEYDSDPSHSVVGHYYPVKTLNSDSLSPNSRIAVPTDVTCAIVNASSSSSSSNNDPLMNQLFIEMRGSVKFRNLRTKKDHPSDYLAADEHLRQFDTAL